jgi:hypothetical protein
MIQSGYGYRVELVLRFRNYLVVGATVFAMSAYVSYKLF